MFLLQGEVEMNARIVQPFCPPLDELEFPAIDYRIAVVYEQLIVLEYARSRRQWWCHLNVMWVTYLCGCVLYACQSILKNEKRLKTGVRRGTIFVWFFRENFEMINFNPNIQIRNPLHHPILTDFPLIWLFSILRWKSTPRLFLAKVAFTNRTIEARPINRVARRERQPEQTSPTHIQHIEFQPWQFLLLHEGPFRREGNPL